METGTQVGTVRSAEPPDDARAEFSAYVAGRWPRLVRSAVLLGCPTGEAEDVVQTALAGLWRHWARVSAADDVDAYVHRSLINTFVSGRRRLWRGEVATAELPERAAPPGPGVEDLLVVGALRRLPVDQRHAVVLRYSAHLSERQMAEALGVAPGTVKSRLSRGLAALSADPDLTELHRPGGAP